MVIMSQCGEHDRSKNCLHKYKRSFCNYCIFYSLQSLFMGTGGTLKHVAGCSWALEENWGKFQPACYWALEEHWGKITKLQLVHGHWRSTGACCSLFMGTGRNYTVLHCSIPFKAVLRIRIRILRIRIILPDPDPNP